MATLTGSRWERYVPDLGDNRTLERPFFLLVRGGLTEAQLQEHGEKLRSLDGTPESAARALADVVRLGDEPLTLDGQAVTTLEEYVRAVWTASRFDVWLELVRAVAWHNSLEGRRALFSARLSGGWASTPAPPTPGAARAATSGSSTKA